MRRTIAVILALLLPWLPACAEAIDRGETAFSKDPPAIEGAAASAVRLEVYDSRGEKIGTGSGFAAFDPMVLVTARHVIVNMAYMIATRDDGTTFRIDRALNADEDADVALLALPDDAGLDPLPVSRGTPMRGAAITAIGSQFGLVNLVSLGNVCGIWQTDPVDWILFSAPVSSGCSGGPLLDDEGTVIGVIAGTYDKAQNLNLAAPIDAAYALIHPTTIEGGSSK